jgi:hypothetical protein
VGNAVGARIGDNYNWQYLGFLNVTNSVILHNYRNIFLKTWNSPGSSWDTNSWVDRLGQADFHGNWLGASDARFPDNQVWDAGVDAGRLVKWMTTPPDAPVGIGVALRTNRIVLSASGDGIPVRLSSFTSHRVDVGYVVTGTNGMAQSGTLRFEPGETVKAVALGNLSGSVFRFALRDAVGGVVTGLEDVWLFDVTQGGTASPVELVAAGSRWSYLDTGADPGTAWRAADYDDSGWSNGLAQLGFSNGEEKDEATLIRRTGTNGQNAITFYFRQGFVLPSGIPALENLSLWMLRDDGGVAYLNGVEVFRSDSMPTAPAAITFQTLATNYNAGAAPPDNTIDRATLPASVLRPGTNVVAVEIHQQAQGSSDLSFDFSLTGNPVLPALRITSPLSNQASPLGGAVVFRIDAEGPGPLGFRWWHNETQLVDRGIGPELVLTNLVSTDAGDYRVEIVSLGGSISSFPATLSLVQADLDADGMPDDWELAHGLDAGRNDAAEDADRDGLSNIAEYQTGTHPGLASSVLRLSASPVLDAGEASVNLSFEAVAGHAYTVLETGTIQGSAWVELARIPAAGTNRVVTIPAPAATNLPARFYRVQTPAVP